MDLPPSIAECANCTAPLSGVYCSSCGQRATALRPTLRDLAHEAVHEVAHFDGKVLKTLRYLLTAPGFLTREFIDGRRARYITPLRLYLTCSVIFFATVALLPERKLKVSVTNSSVERLQRGASVLQKDPSRLAEAFRRNLPRVAFVLMPVFGAFVFLLFRRVEPTYVPHLYFAVHYHAFAFLLMTGVAALTASRSIWLSITGLLLLLATLPYLAVSLRRVYGGSRKIAAAKATAIWLAYGVVVLTAVTLIMLITVWQVAG